MTRPDDIADLIDRLGAAALDCRQAIREAHEAIQDLRAATKQARQLLDGGEVQTRIETAAKNGLDELGELIGRQRDEVCDRILTTFDQLATPLKDSLLLMTERANQITATQNMLMRQLNLTGSTEFDPEDTG